MIKVTQLRIPGCSSLETNDSELLAVLNEQLGLGREGDSVTVQRISEDRGVVTYLVTKAGALSRAHGVASTPQVSRSGLGAVTCSICKRETFVGEPHECVA